ncbi:hypothetical protein [Shewanella litoralis]|uniref:hypothetical protein n=1 Tax=Shewanella litoralis TaxID=2282700 RepID=UPI00135B766F|nr:hypothetical protein [Shewanella litoralis]
MLKSISLVILSFSLLATANAVANPLALFVEQCLQYKPDLTSLKQEPVSSSVVNAVEFEKQTLALNNINDRIQYYRPFATDSLSKQGLLWCQLHLADELYELTTAKQTQQLIDVLQYQSAPYNQLAEQLKHIKDSQWSLTEKSKLHSAQATVNQALSERQLQMQFNDEQCLLASQSVIDENTQQASTNIDIHIAKYLLKQPNAKCRQQAWVAYQLRAKSKLLTAMSYIHELQQQRAIEQGYLNAAELALAPYDLTPAMLNRFLDTQTKSIGIAPWDIAQALFLTQKAAPIEVVSSQDYLSQLFDQLIPLGIRIEYIAQQDTVSDSKTDNINIIRIWHQQRLLGEIYTYPLSQQQPQQSSKSALSISGQLIKQTVIGHQFGQYALSFPAILTTQKQQQKLIAALSDAIVSLAQGGQFYLLAHKTQNKQQHAIASLWLSHYLTQLQPFSATSEREQLALQYQQQMRVFRSKVALHYYQFSGNLDNSDWLAYNTELSAAFADSFGQSWPSATDAIYSFQAIANEGISHYLPLWQDAVAQLIISQSAAQHSSLDIFNLLIVNEAYLPFNDQLEQLIGSPIDPHSLIWRFKHASTAQE